MEERTQQLRTYDVLVIVPAQSMGEGLERAKSLFQEAVKKHGGTVANRTELGRRPLGYSVQRAKEGYVMVFEIRVSPSEAAGLVKTLRLTEEILKFTITVKPQLKAKAARRLPPKLPAHAER